HRANRRRPSFNSRAIVRAASQASTASDKRAAETDAKLKRLYDAIENGIVDLADPMLKDRIAELKAIRDQARADAERADGASDRLGPAHHTTPSQNFSHDRPQPHAARVPPRSRPIS